MPVYIENALIFNYKSTKMKKNYLLLLLLLLTVTAKAQNDYVPTVYGNIIWMNSFTSDTDERMGVYSFQAAPETEYVKHISNSNFYATGNGLMTAGEYNFISAWEYDGEMVYQLYTYNTETWELKNPPVDVNATWCANDFTQDPTTGTVYGLCSTANLQSTELCIIDFASRTRQPIAHVDQTLLALACSNDGQLYAIGDDNKLYKIDKEFGDITAVGSLGLEKINRSWIHHDIELGRLQSATFDHKTNTLYWAAQLWNTTTSSMASELLKIDINNTENTEIVTEFPENAQFVSLYIPEPTANDNAPAAATNISKNFEGGSLTGQIIFTAPTKTYGGDELTGNLGYKILVDDKVVGSGNTTAGTETTANVTVETEGMTRFVIQVSNENGDGEPAVYRTYIGYDQTEAPLNAKLDIADGVAKITWDAPEKSLNDGYFNQSELKYVVKRYASAGAPTEIGTTDQGVCELEYTLPASRYLKYHFGITAVNNSKRSEEAMTDDMAYGPAKEITEEESYNEPFNSANSFNEWTALDMNGDKVVEVYPEYGISFHYGLWDMSTNGGRVVYYPGNEPNIDADDWLLSPLLKMSADKYYKLSFDAYRGSSRFENEEMSVAIGTTFNVEDFTTAKETFCPDTLANETDATNYVAAINVAEDGNYHVGFHVTSPAYQGLIYVDNVKVEIITKEEYDEIINSQHTGIDGVAERKDAVANDVYDINGVRVKTNSSSLDGLKKGVYIVGGKKVVKR